MILLTFLGGLIAGFYLDFLRKNHLSDHYKRELVKLTAHTDAMKDTVELLTNKVERMQKAGIIDEREQIDAGILDGIHYVLKQKLRKVKY